jgi:hypothetical protein
MKPQLLRHFKYLIAACVLALGVGTANADTYIVTGTSGPGTDGSRCGPYPGSACDFTWSSATLSGTLDVTGATVTDMSLSVTVSGVFDFSYTFTGPNGCSPIYLCTVKWFPMGPYTPVFEVEYLDDGIQEMKLDIDFYPATNSLTFTYLGGRDTFMGYDSYAASWTDGTGSYTVTPLPAALPLFATGLGGLGLLGWRRKRKAQAGA